jgi:HD-GYP domain-containing protein (c-di-GMP phosphodiesterase class II)
MTAATTAEVFGADDRKVKADGRRIDQTRPAESLRYIARNLAPGGSVRERAKHLRALVAFGVDGGKELSAMRCERGADVARAIDLPEDAALAIWHLDEHWDGRGYPMSLEGEAISVMGRILCLAQTMEIFWQDGGRDAAVEVARDRCGTWFDPALCDIAAGLHGDDAFWAGLERADISGAEPADRRQLADDERLDSIALAFGQVVDAKSPYTARHSQGVAEIAVGLATTLGLGPVVQRTMHRAGLLHDIGKLGVSNRILDKPGKLDAEEWVAIKRHPELSMAILGQVDVFSELAWLGGTHHERLDGSGYPFGLRAGELDLPARVLQVADVAEALTAERPYRAALPLDEVFAIIDRDTPAKLDGDVVDALHAWLPSRAGASAAVAAA